jgi:16S rRNA (guanine1516-N2)-methyltransferase
LQLIHASSLTALTDITPRPQVVYLDPMFPHKQKSALVKKEMRVFQSLVGPDLDADGLLEPARQLATKRVVVKRPDYAPPLADVATTNAVTTKGHRFDIYPVRRNKKAGWRLRLTRPTFRLSCRPGKR